MEIIPGEVPTAKLHAQLLSAVAPRPIAFASTVNAKGEVNLSPYSFFNVFSSNPPIAIFSPARRVRDNTIKHTLENIREVPEVVINIVNYSMVQQTSLASTEYPKGVNEFVKAGFTEVPSLKVKPPRVMESPVQLECRVKEVIELGTQGGAGNLIVAEIVHVHISDDVLNAQGVIDQHKIDLVGRLGGDWYVRASGDALFTVPKPLATLGVGIDALPEAIKFSKVLSGNDLGMLGNVEELPSESVLEDFRNSGEKRVLFEQEGINFQEKDAPHRLASRLLSKNEVNLALKVLLS
jgi:flavin reductase (DIM6/NTAB) family NADH-FMN oxidoreductase RutF